MRYVIHSAGIAAFEDVFETSPSQFDRQYGVNVKPNIFITQTIAKDLKARRLSGSVVHVSSQSSTLALRDHLVYSSASVVVVFRRVGVAFGERALLP